MHLLATLVRPAHQLAQRLEQRGAEVGQPVFHARRVGREHLAVEQPFALQGGCIGGGVDMVTACDMRYCTANAFFCVKEIAIGITADVGTLQRLPRLIPDGLARELSYTGRNLAAEEARSSGLVNQVFADQAAMLDGVMAIAKTIAGHSPLAMTGTKEMLNYGRNHSITDGLNYVATWNAGMLAGEDLPEAMKAARERRAANYAGLQMPAL